MIIVGGTYSEICFEPIWENIFGSGFRAVSLILAVDDTMKIDFYTCADNVDIAPYLKYHERLYPTLTNHITEISKSPEFHYDYPLKPPTIRPRPDVYDSKNISLNVTGDDILAFGLLEASIKIQGKKVVYDPQSPVKPILFSETASSAEQLVVVTNFTEGKKLSGRTKIEGLRDFFFNQEKCFALIVKMGAKGAYLFKSKDAEPIKIPVFETNEVWPIGSGDIFSTFFAYNWFCNKTLDESALLASKATAIYCNSKDLSISETLEFFPFKELRINKIPSGQIYLAGPFFTFSQRWLVNEVWNAFKSFGLQVFSPFHDVGHGRAKDVVDKDLEGLNSSEIVFAIIDGLDSGTLFEVGYAICQEKRVIAFVQNEGEESLKMLEGTNCIIERDLTTAIYKLYWELGKK